MADDDLEALGEAEVRRRLASGQYQVRRASVEGWLAKKEFERDIADQAAKSRSDHSARKAAWVAAGAAVVARPATGSNPTVNIRLPPTLVKQIEAYATSRGISRSEAIRSMIEASLPAE